MLQSQLPEEYETYRAQATECINLENDLEYIRMMLERNNLSREDKAYLSEQFSEKSNRHAEIVKKVEQYQNQFKRMIKGICKEKELEIDKQKEDMQIRQMEEKRRRDKEHIRQLETQIENLERQVRSGKTDIVDMLEQYVRDVEETSLQYRGIAEDLKIGYSQNLHFKILEMVQNIKTKLETTETDNRQRQDQQEEYYTIKRDRLQEQYGNLLQQKEKIEQIQKQMQKLPFFIEEHKRQSFQEIKANLNTKVQGMITKARVTHLQTEKQQVVQEKESRWQRIFYGTTLKDEKLENIEAKIDLERKQALTRNPENSVEIMMANLYDCCAQDLNGEFQPEMEETIYAIRRNFDKLPNEQMLAEQAYQKANSNYPAILGSKRLSKRKQIHYYHQNTEKTKAEIYDTTSQNKPIHKEVQINALSKFEETITCIKTMIEKNEEPSYEVNRSSLQIR